MPSQYPPFPPSGPQDVTPTQRRQGEFLGAPLGGGVAPGASYAPAYGAPSYGRGPSFQGAPAYGAPHGGGTSSPRGLLPTLIMCLMGIFGIAGLHRIYAGKVATGLLWLLTGGLAGVGTLVDIILIATRSFRDKEGRVIDR